MADDLSLTPSTALEPLTVEDMVDVSIDQRRQEAFLLYATGWTQTRIAKQLGVSQRTISSDLATEISRRRSRAANVEDEIERITGLVEHVMVKALDRHNEAAESNINSVAATNYLKLVLEAADRYANLRGFAEPSVRTKAPGDVRTRVVVQIGGGNQPAINVGVETE